MNAPPLRCLAKKRVIFAEYISDPALAAMRLVRITRQTNVRSTFHSPGGSCVGRRGNPLYYSVFVTPTPVYPLQGAGEKVSVDLLKIIIKLDIS